jgi:hypothetical protein
LEKLKEKVSNNWRVSCGCVCWFVCLFFGPVGIFQIGNGVGIVGGIGIGTGMAQTSSSSSISGTAAGRAATTAGCVIDGIDISTCTDDFKLNEMVRTKRQPKIIEQFWD